MVLIQLKLRTTTLTAKLGYSLRKRLVATGTSLYQVNAENNDKVGV